MARWRITEDKPGVHDVTRGGKIIRYDAGTFEECRDLIIGHRRWDPQKDSIIYDPLEGPARAIRKF